MQTRIKHVVDQVACNDHDEHDTFEIRSDSKPYKRKRKSQAQAHLHRVHTNSAWTQDRYYTHTHTTEICSTNRMPHKPKSHNTQARNKHVDITLTRGTLCDQYLQICTISHESPWHLKMPDESLHLQMYAEASGKGIHQNMSSYVDPRISGVDDKR